MAGPCERRLRSSAGSVRASSWAGITTSRRSGSPGGRAGAGSAARAARTDHTPHHPIQGANAAPSPTVTASAMGEVPEELALPRQVGGVVPVVDVEGRRVLAVDVDEAVLVDGLAVPG